MSSSFPGGAPDFFSASAGGGRSTNILPSILDNNTQNLQQQYHQQYQQQQQQQQISLRSPLSGILNYSETQIRRPEFVGKRSFSDFQQQQQQQQSLEYYLRNVKQKPFVNFSNRNPFFQQHQQQSILSPMSFSQNSLIQVNNNSPLISSILNSNSNSNLQQNRPQPLILRNDSEEEKKRMDRSLKELEKTLLGDDDEEEEENGEEKTVSVVTNSEWSQTIQNLLSQTQQNQTPLASSSPTSSTSSCTSTLASTEPPCTKQLLFDAAVSITEGRPEIATEILTRLQPFCNRSGTSEQRITAHIVTALNSRVNPKTLPPPISELYSLEHAVSTQLLYNSSPCFKLAFMAANFSIIETTNELGFNKIHVLDFDIGQGGQYFHLLHVISAAASDPVELKITALTVSSSGVEDQKLKTIADRLQFQASKMAVQLSISVKNVTMNDLTRENLDVKSDEALVVNFAFHLYKLPDESVTTDNLRDELLRRVKSLSPAVMTVVEEELNANTAPLSTRVREAREHYGAIFDSLDSTINREIPERVKMEEGLSRKLCNSLACEGRERFERCEVYGKWRARFSMAGFKPRFMSQHTADSLRVKLNSLTRGNPGFIVSEQNGGICFGWMGRIITVASAWN